MAARPTKILWRMLLAAAILSRVAEAQISVLSSSGAGPQARSRDELAAAGAIYEAPDARQVALAAVRFIQVYPASEFSEYAHVALMHARLELGNRAGAEQAGGNALKLAPKNIDALLCLAEISAERGSSNSSARQTAVEYASRALQQLQSLTIPPAARRGAWLRSKKDLLARAYAILGWLAFEEGRSAEAIEKIRTATGLDAQGLYFYRLALVYEGRHEIEPAIDSLEEAQRIGTAAIQGFAAERLRKLRLLKAGIPAQ